MTTLNTLVPLRHVYNLLDSGTRTRKIFLAIFVLFVVNTLQTQTKMEISDKQIVLTKNINLPLDTLWWKWTTHEGLKTFFGSDNKIELLPGGAFEIYFLMDSPYGTRGSEDCKIISFETKKFLCFTWNAPPQFEQVRKSVYKTHVTVEFKYLTSHQTELILRHAHWPQSENWNPVFDYFSKAWEVVLNNLAKN